MENFIFILAEGKYTVKLTNTLRKKNMNIIFFFIDFKIFY